MTVFARIAGTGSYLPDKLVSNDDLAKLVDTSDEWIYSRTGIRQRHYAADDQNASDLAHAPGLPQPRAPIPLLLARHKVRSDKCRA